jgi:pyruvate-formate lyase
MFHACCCRRSGESSQSRFFKFTLNVDTLRAAPRHPELHRNLVVRVWGWSGHFCELDEAYQNQIIGRHIYG